MTIDSHNRVSKRSHSREKEEYAKENDIRKQMSDEEYDREKAEIRIYLDLLMEIVLRSI